MDLLYTWSLLVALVAGAVGILLGLFLLLRRAASERLSEANMRGRLVTIRTAFMAVVLGALSLAISIVVHWRWGHGTASAEPMDVASFVSAHEAFLVAGLVIVVALVLIACAQKRRRDSR